MEQRDGTPGDRQATHQTGGVFQREGEYWTLAYGGTTSRLRDAAGMRHLAHLLARLPPFIVTGQCAPAAFSTGALLGSGSAGTLDGIATNASRPAPGRSRTTATTGHGSCRGDRRHQLTNQEVVR